MKKIISLIVAGIVSASSCMTLLLNVPIHTDAATRDDLNQNGVFLKQQESDSCTLCAAAMLVRRVAMMRGDSDWNTISEAGLKTVMNWDEIGLSWDFTYRDIRIIRKALPSDYDSKVAALIDLMAADPEGIIVYDSAPFSPGRNAPHAVLLTDYTDGIFYCAEPANSMPAGRIPLTSSLVSLDSLDSFWYCTSPLVSLDPDNIPSKPSLQVQAGSTIKETVLSWDACSNTEWYDVRIYRKSDNECIYFNTVRDTSLRVQLPQGEWLADVAAVNSAEKWTFSEKAAFDTYLSICEPAAITTYNGHVYSLYENKLYYEQAKTLCEQSGGHLAVISSEEENSIITSMLQSASDNEYWLGASDTKKEGTWEWVTGEKFKYQNWRNDEPNNADEVEHYLTIYPEGEWNDARSMTTYCHGFIMEIEALKPTAVEQFNGHSYQRYDIGINWAEANAYCKMIGGDLTTISSNLENAFVKDLVASGEKTGYWIGLYDAKKDGNYQWASGEKSDYRNWEESQPDCARGEEYYIEIYKDSGLFNDVPNYLDGRDGFICELNVSLLKGDVNNDGVLDVADTLMLQQFLLGNPILTGGERALIGDMNDDGKINAVDLSLLKAVIIAKQ